MSTPNFHFHIFLFFRLFFYEASVLILATHRRIWFYYLQIGMERKQIQFKKSNRLLTHRSFRSKKKREKIKTFKKDRKKEVSHLLNPPIFFFFLESRHWRECNLDFKIRIGLPCILPSHLHVYFWKKFVFCTDSTRSQDEKLVVPVPSLTLTKSSKIAFQLFYKFYNRANPKADWEKCHNIVT